MSQRDTINGMTAAEAILSTIIEQVANMPTDSAFHARSAVMIVNRMVKDRLYRSNGKPYHFRVADVSMDCSTLAARPYIDKYEKQVYETAERVAYEYYEAVMHHSHMEAPLPF